MSGAEQPTIFGAIYERAVLVEEAERLTDAVWDLLGAVRSGPVLAVLENRERLRELNLYDGSEEAERVRVAAVEELRAAGLVVLDPKGEITDLVGEPDFRPTPPGAKVYRLTEPEETT